MIITLVTLALLLLSIAALLRSFHTSLAIAGNLAFKRDLVNQGERGMAKAIDLLKSGALDSSSVRTANLLSSNYYATELDSDSHGIPLLLIKDSAFTGTATDITDDSSGITVRYVIDRLCNSTGSFSTSTCESFKVSTTTGGSSSNATSKVGLEYQPVYRISVRVNGPRNTQTYLQTTVTL